MDIAVHLDHGLTVDTVKKALELGFTSVMYDSSSFPFEKISKGPERWLKLLQSMGQLSRQSWDWLAEARMEVPIMASAAPIRKMQRYFVRKQGLMHLL